MTLAQFIHVAQFYETILCFSILVLIGQRLIMMSKNLDQKYLRARAKEFDDQIDWEKSFTHQKEIIAQEQQQQRRRQQEIIKVQQEGKQIKEQKRQAQAPKQQNLKTSLIQSQHDQTDRNLTQNQEIPEIQSAERKSLTDLRRSRQNLSKQLLEIKNDDASNKSESSQNRRDSSNSGKGDSNSGKQDNKEGQQSKQTRKKTTNFQGAELNSVEMQDQEKPQVNPELQDEDILQKQQKENQHIRYYIRIDAIFNEYLPILMSVLVIGILTHSTYIFTMVCFFGYLFASLLFNYANLLSKLQQQPAASTIFSKTNKLFAGLFIIALFINYWADNQFS